MPRLLSFSIAYCATRASGVDPPIVPLPSLTTASAPISGNPGRAAGVAYVTLKVHVPPAASGVVNEQVFRAAGTEYKPPMLTRKFSAVICKGPVPLLVTVTTLVTAARGVGIMNVRVRTPTTVTTTGCSRELNRSDVNGIRIGRIGPRMAEEVGTRRSRKGPARRIARDAIDGRRTGHERVITQRSKHSAWCRISGRITQRQRTVEHVNKVVAFIHRRCGVQSEQRIEGVDVWNARRHAHSSGRSSIRASGSIRVARADLRCNFRGYARTVAVLMYNARTARRLVRTAVTGGAGQDRIHRVEPRASVR